MTTGATRGHTEPAVRLLQARRVERRTPGCACVHAWLALACISTCPGFATAQSETTGIGATTGDTAPERMEPVTVTGTRLSGAAAQSAQEIRTYDRGRI